MVSWMKVYVPLFHEQREKKIRKRNNMENKFEDDRNEVVYVLSVEVLRIE